MEETKVVPVFCITTNLVSDLGYSGAPEFYGEKLAKYLRQRGAEEVAKDFAEQLAAMMGNKKGAEILRSFLELYMGPDVYAIFCQEAKKKAGEKGALKYLQGDSMLAYFAS